MGEIEGLPEGRRSPWFIWDRHYRQAADLYERGGAFDGLKTFGDLADYKREFYKRMRQFGVNLYGDPARLPE